MSQSQTLRTLAALLGLGQVLTLAVAIQDQAPTALKTSISVDPTIYTYVPNPHYMPNVVATSMNTATRSFVDPAVITSLPTTIVQTEYADLHYTVRYETYSMDSWGQIHREVTLGTHVSSSSTTGTQLSTYIVYEPQATHIPGGTKLSDLPCKECASPLARPDDRCASRKRGTACQGQCLLREDGLFWCYQMRRSIEIRYGKGMGRVCWGNVTTYAQLVEPCVLGDHAFECVPCEGQTSRYAPQDWIQV